MNILMITIAFTMLLVWEVKSRKILIKEIAESKARIKAEREKAMLNHNYHPLKK